MDNEPLERILSRINERSNLEISQQQKSNDNIIKCRSCNEKEAEIGGLCVDCREKERNLQVIERINYCVPKKYRDLDSDKFDSLKIQLGENLFITGGVGTGKTLLSCSIAKFYIRNGWDVKFLNYPAFIMDLQSSYRNNSENPYEIAEEVADFGGQGKKRFINPAPGILILDDLGAEKLTDYVRQITYFIINEREQNCLPTIITSNFSLQQLDEFIDPRISSRVAGMCRIIRFTGKDRRINKNI